MHGCFSRNRSIQAYPFFENFLWFSFRRRACQLHHIIFGALLKVRARSATTCSILFMWQKSSIFSIYCDITNIKRQLPDSFIFQGPHQLFTVSSRHSNKNLYNKSTPFFLWEKCTEFSWFCNGNFECHCVTLTMKAIRNGKFPRKFSLQTQETIISSFYGFL